METPARGVHYIHGAIRREAANIEEIAAALDPQTRDQIAQFGDRLAFLRKVAKTHNDNEDAIIFTVLDTRLPHVVESYRLDHQAGEEVFAEVEETLARLQSAEDGAGRSELALRLARQTAALSAIVGLYIQKEEQHLVPLQEQYFTIEEQAENGTRVSGSFGRELLAKVMPWILRMQTVDEREALFRMGLTAMPPAFVTALAGWGKAGLPAEEWAEVVRRVPELASV